MSTASDIRDALEQQARNEEKRQRWLAGLPTRHSSGYDPVFDQSPYMLRIRKYCRRGVQVDCIQASSGRYIVIDKKALEDLQDLKVVIQQVETGNLIVGRDPVMRPNKKDWLHIRGYFVNFVRNDVISVGCHRFKTEDVKRIIREVEGLNVNGVVRTEPA